MPRGDKSAYTDKQKRKAGHIEEGYEKRGVSSKEAESRAWATVNKQEGGGKKSGSGRSGSTKSSSRGQAKSTGRKSSGHSGGRTSASRSEAAKKGWETRRRNQRKSSARS